MIPFTHFVQNAVDNDSKENVHSFVALKTGTSLSFNHNAFCLVFFNYFVYLFVGFYVPLKNFSLIWRRHHYRLRASNFDPHRKIAKHICNLYLLDICSTCVELMWTYLLCIFSTHGHWIVKVVFRATLTCTRDINDHPPFVTTRPFSLRNSLVNSS